MKCRKKKSHYKYLSNFITALQSFKMIKYLFYFVFIYNSMALYFHCYFSALSRGAINDDEVIKS